MAVVDLADAKAFLRIGDDQSDAVLPAFIDAAQASIESRCGGLEPVAATIRVRGGDVLVLPSPAVDLTTVTPSDDGEALVVADLHLDRASGVVSANDGSGFPARYYTVEYQAGRATCPDDLVLAVKELLRHNWISSQRAPRSSGPTSTETANTVPGAAYLFPFRVEQLIAPHVQAGFA